MRVMTEKEVTEIVFMLSQVGIILMDSKQAMHPRVNQELTARVLDLLVKIGGDDAVGKHYRNSIKHRIRRSRCTEKRS